MSRRASHVCRQTSPRARAISCCDGSIWQKSCKITGQPLTSVASAAHECAEPCQCLSDRANLPRMVAGIPKGGWLNWDSNCASVLAHRIRYPAELPLIDLRPSSHSLAAPARSSNFSRSPSKSIILKHFVADLVTSVGFGPYISHLDNSTALGRWAFYLSLSTRLRFPCRQAQKTRPLYSTPRLLSLDLVRCTRLQAFTVANRSCRARHVPFCQSSFRERNSNPFTSSLDPTRLSQFVASRRYTCSLSAPPCAPSLVLFF